MTDIAVGRRNGPTRLPGYSVSEELQNPISGFDSAGNPIPAIDIRVVAMRRVVNGTLAKDHTLGVFTNDRLWVPNVTGGLVARWGVRQYWGHRSRKFSRRHQMAHVHRMARPTHIEMIAIRNDVPLGGHEENLTFCDRVVFVIPEWGRVRGEKMDVILDAAAGEGRHEIDADYIRRALRSIT